MSIKNIIRPFILILFYFQLSLAQSLIINESMSKNLSSVYDEDGDTPDWVEIYNNSTDPINLGNYYLSDDVNNLQKWQFPEGTLSPDSHIVVFASDKDRTIWPKGYWLPVINFGAIWHYLPGSDQIPSNWNTTGYDVSTWSSGHSAIGYGDGDDLTIIDPVLSVFMVKHFEINNLQNIIFGLLHMDYDDGFIVYVNGNEVIRENLGEPGTEVLYNQFADTNVEANIYRGLKPEKFLIENITDFLLDGQNSIAIQVHNASENLNDLTALPILSFYTEDPPLPSDSYEIKITINTDSYPGETSWQLIGINGTFYNESVLPGSITQSNTLYEWTFDVPLGDYQFTIMDSWGDGICCEDGVPVEIYNPGWEFDGGWGVWPSDVTTANWEHSQGDGHSDSYRSLELFGTSSNGIVTKWQNVDVFPGELHHLSVYAKHSTENPLQTGQTGFAYIEFWAWGLFGPYMIEQHTTEIMTTNSPFDTWIKLDIAAEAPEEAGWSALGVRFTNPNGDSDGAVHFDNISYRNNVHSENTNFYSSGNYSVYINESQVIQGGTFTDMKSDTFDTENLFSDLLNYQNPYLHTNFKITSSGETIFITDEESTFIDTMFVPEMEQNLSFGYFNDGSGTLGLFDNPTPGTTNNYSESFYGYTADPVFSDVGGFMNQYFNLYIESETENSTIFYTTDGSKPTQASNIYNSYISINENLLYNGTTTADDYGVAYSPTYDGIVIRAIAVAPDHVQSNIITHSYIFDPVNDYLPAISIAIKPDDMWDPNIGMHVGGNAFWPWYPFPGSNFWQDWEKEVHIELFEPGGEIGFKQDAGMKIFGGWSRAEAQKSFSFFARSTYGEGSFNYKLFPDSEVDSYESFILRAHGQDNVMFRDGFHTSLASENGVAVQDYRPAVVYLNGEFWGIQNIREKVNEHYVATHYGIENDNLDLLSTVSSSPDPELLHGSTEDYLEIRQFMSNNDLSVETNYIIASQQYDVESLIDYKIAQIFVMNYDWPGNNNKLFKAKSNDGKWRHIMFDSDFGFQRWGDGNVGWIGSYESYNMLDHAVGDGNVFNNPLWSTAIFTAFLDNSEFKTQFINTYLDRINTTYSTGNTTYLIDSLRMVIDPYISDHIERYGPNPGDSYTPNTLEEHNSAVELMYNFADFRPQNARDEMVEMFDLSGELNTISLYVNDTEWGHIKINSLNIDDQSWSGKYFSDVPISIKAVPEFGYEFSYWGGQPNFDDSISLALTEDMSLVAYFSESQNQYTNAIAINEINYHSNDDFDPGDWVELYNYSDQPINLFQWSFKDSDDSHVFNFDQDLIIEAGGYLVICRDSADFSQSFPEVDNYIGEIDFGLSNGGELIRLLDDNDGLVDFVNYDDADPWPTEADGIGNTLELLNPTLDNNISESWTASFVEFGTPGHQNSSYDALTNDVDNNLPSVFVIHQNFPNPFNPKTNISYDLPNDSYTVVKVYDLLGKHVKTLIDREQTAGYKTLVWDSKNEHGENVSAGVYIYQIKSGLNLSSKKMILLK